MVKQKYLIFWGVVLDKEIAKILPKFDSSRHSDSIIISQAVGEVL
jgi:hypothetical protein